MILQRWRGRPDKVMSAGLPGYRAYAIGDVHGRLDLLDGLLEQIAADHHARGGDAKPLLVFLGDLIDRGPASRGVLERVASGALAGFRTVTLLGNHEEVLLRVLDGESELFGQWLGFGGGEFLLSYGLDELGLGVLSREVRIAELQRAIPPEHQSLLRSMGDTLRFGDYLFVHAGIRPGVPLAQQSPVDLRWIRQPFLGDRRDHGVIVVHGHTIVRKIEDLPNRIGIDAGAYRFGVLSALAVEGRERWFLQQDGSTVAPPQVAAPPLR